jgi:CubicO group peptidase (beta-lactamase class C family)
MMISTFRTLRFTLIFLSLFWAGRLMGQSKYEGTGTVQELKTKIEQVLNETHTPAAGVALVQGDSIIWAGSLGKANLETNVNADENTMFRIGSVSKMFVSLAILKLQEQGRVSLDSKVRDLAPDLAFINPWEKQAPILVKHLLEHTTGWDDLYLKDYAMNDPKMTLKQGLDYNPKSRTSRWMPGTRMAYSNSGPPVAAYIIEKITGQRFEDYIQEQFFTPMGMESMTYFATDIYKKRGAALYQDNKLQKYWNIIVRPSGAINASPRDMAKMLKFFINRGRIDSLNLVSEKSLQRMETSATTVGAKNGLEYGYGLGNYTSAHKSYIYRNHGGGVLGGLTDFSYLPNHQVGYAIMINSGNFNALMRIQYLVREFQTHHLTSDLTFRPETPGPAPQIDINGYYMLINPRIQLTDYLQRITDIQHIWSKDKFIFHSGLFGGGVQTYKMINNHQFASNETGKIKMVTAKDPIAGDVIQADTLTLRRVSPFLVFGQLGILGLWICYMLGSIIFGIIWFVRYTKGKPGAMSNRAIILWPVLASLTMILATIMASAGAKDPFELLGKVSYASVSVMVFTIGFALFTVISVFNILIKRKAAFNQSTYIHMAVLTGLHLIATCYLFWYGMIGIQTWN